MACKLSDENWRDVVKHEDVKYSSENKSLYFDGEGDYFELTKNSDFSSGFKFVYKRYDNSNPEWEEDGNK